MPLQMVFIYASGAALITLMAAFAVHNKKIGWKRARPTLLEALNDLYADLGVGMDAPQGSVPTINHSAPPEADFSLQLLTLRGALGSSKPIALSGELADHYLAKEAQQLITIGTRR